MASDLREQLRTILTSGLSEDPLEHAGQVARIAGVLHRAFGAEIDEAWLRGKLEHEGSLDALEPLRALAAGDERVTAGTLRALLEGLRGRTR